MKSPARTPVISPLLALPVTVVVVVFLAAYERWRAWKAGR